MPKKYRTAKYANLEYKVLYYNEDTDLSLVEVNLNTGRHHQIRVQFSNIGHPLYGDHLYGGHGEIHMQLHAYKLSFLHPISKERLEFTNIPNGEIWDKFNLNNCEL